MLLKTKKWMSSNGKLMHTTWDVFQCFFLISFLMSNLSQKVITWFLELAVIVSKSVVSLFLWFYF